MRLDCTGLGLGLRDHYYKVMTIGLGFIGLGWMRLDCTGLGL